MDKTALHALCEESGLEHVTGDNYYRDKTGCWCFAVPQRYLIPINEPEELENNEEGSVTCMVIQVMEGSRIFPFFRNFRKFLHAHGVPAVQYAYLSNLPEILQCGELPEVK